MVGPGIPKDSNFIHQYGGAVNQYGTVGSGPISDENAGDFQKHMQIEGAQNQQVPKISPHDLMSGQLHPQFNTPQISPMNGPAPENFGPPRIGNIATDNSSQFGPPNSQGFKNVSQQLGSPKPSALQGQAGTPTDPNQVNSRQQQMQARLQNAQSSTQQAGMSLNSANSQAANLQSGAQSGNSGGGGGGGKNKDVTYKSVEKQAVDSMLENAMSHMKFKDPDPSSWS